mmetsp:Transcript_83543/g.233146  ORF Transcript_83543/g.233146 Transcript_83543/m.233146 type:complete len:314 (+) Transcript_83543:887-1828(+)
MTLFATTGSARELLEHPIPDGAALGTLREELEVEVVRQDHSGFPVPALELGLVEQEHGPCSVSGGALHHQRPWEPRHGCQQSLRVRDNWRSAGAWHCHRHNLEPATRALHLPRVQPRVPGLVQVQPTLVARRQLSYHLDRKVAGQGYIARQLWGDDPECLQLDARRSGAVACEASVGPVRSIRAFVQVHVGTQRRVARGRHGGDADTRRFTRPIRPGRRLRLRQAPRREDRALAIPEAYGHEVPVDPIEHETFHEVKQAGALALVQRPKGGHRVHRVAVKLRQHHFAVSDEHWARGVAVVGREPGFGAARELG